MTNGDVLPNLVYPLLITNVECTCVIFKFMPGKVVEDSRGLWGRLGWGGRCSSVFEVVSSCLERSAAMPAEPLAKKTVKLRVEGKRHRLRGRKLA